MFYKVKFINNSGIYRTLIISDKYTQASLEKTKQIKEEKYEYSNNTIYLDDTIENIKYKIIKSIGIDISVDEIYLFATRKIKYTSKEIYDILSQNQQLPITRAKYFNYLSNFSEIKLDMLEKKDVYTYDDIITLDIDQKILTERFVIGMDFNLGSKYPVSINPYATLLEDNLLLQKNNLVISTHNKNILLNYNTLDDNTIYVCLAQELFALKKTEYYSKIYFPLLAKDKIYTEPELLRERKSLKSNIEDERNIIRYNEKIDFLYNIYLTRDSELPYTTKGINSIEFIIHPNQTTLIPIHTIFRIIETTNERLLVKYNNRKKIEKIFRLFTDKTDKNGEKIPVLTKTEIHKVSEILGRKRSVSMYYRFDTTEVMIDLLKDGDIKVILNSKGTFSVSEIDSQIKSVLNKLLLDINIVIERSGYKYDLFTTITDRHVELLNLSYSKEILITKPLNFEKYYKCLTNVFTIIESDLTKGIELDYKRIAYYKVMNDIEKFITRKHLQQFTLEEVVELVSKNYELSMDDSKLRVTEWMQKTEVEQNTFNGRKLKIKNTSGIPIEITKDKFSNKIKIQITDIDQLLYLETIPIFIDVLLRLSQDTMNESIDRTHLSLLCKDDIKPVKIQNDITPPPEKSFDERVDIVVEKGNVTKLFANNDTDDEDDLLDALDNDDEDDDEDDDIMFEDLGEIDMTPDSDNEAAGGGAKDTPKSDDTKSLITNIDGMSLSNPNYFFERMYSRDPALFLKQPDGMFQSYSRGCPWNYRRHPVILTDKEKETIDRDYPDSYPKDQVFKYGSSPENEHWYICPRYWCLRDNVPLSEQDVKDGKCGGKVIPYSAKKVPKGHYIFEFNAGHRNNEHIKDGKYVQHYPGFLKQDFHPKGKGVPCCFRYWDKGGQQERRKYFLSSEKDIKQKKKRSTVTKEETTEHIQDHLKFPLKRGIIGYLPVSIQKMLGTNNDECKRKKTDVYLKVDKPCLLREGVENSKNQSFLACLAAYNTTGTCSDDCNILSVKTDIKEKLTIDIFVKLQNGSLVEIFYNDVNYKDIDISQFKDAHSEDTMSIVYQLEKKNINYVKKIISAFSEFHKYIERDDTLIDHTYFWDFVSSYHFKDEPDNRVNLIILELVDDDLTNKVDILCPTAMYSTIKFDTKYKCIIMIKNDEFYEPVCMYKYIEYEEAGKLKYKMQMQHNKFSFPNEDPFDAPDVMDSDLKTSVEIIQDNQNKCLIKNKVIQYNDSINVEYILEKISKMPEYVCVGQVLNYNNKIIGILIMNKEISEISVEPVFVPIKPSKILDGIEILTIDDSFSRDYKTTRDVLSLIGDNLDMPSAPMLKVIEDNLIVGILTTTNQFVQISPPSENIYNDDIPEYNGLNYNRVDSEVIFDDSVDTERETAIKKIKLETNFFTAFRNTFRVVLNKLENYKVKQQLIDIIDDYNLFVKKIESVETIIRTLLEPYVVFNVLDDSTIDMLDKIGLCVERAPGEEKSPYCFTDDRGETPKLILPKQHLISKFDNENIYYGRLADELVRYNKIQDYILKENTYLNLVQIPYNLHSNEIILLESLMYKEYFKNLSTVGSRTEMRNTYDTTMYQDGVSELVVRDKKDSVRKEKEKQVCETSARNMAPTDSIYKYLKEMGKLEIVSYGKTIHCMFQLFIDIIKDATKKTVTKQEIKQILSKELNLLVQTENDKMRETFISQGKNYLFSKLEQQENIVDLVESEHYYLTNVDVHILCKHFKLGIITASRVDLRETREFTEKRLFSVNYSTESTHYYILKQAGIKKDKPIEGQLTPIPQIYDLLHLDGQLRFQVKHFSYDFSKLVEANKVSTIFTKKHVKKSRLKLEESVQ